MFKRIARFYSALFRFGGLAMAILSLVVSTVMGIDIARHGYVLVDGGPSRSLSSILTAVGTPLIGVVIGLALYFFVPRVRESSHSKT